MPRISFALMAALVLCGSALAGPLPAGYSCVGVCGTMGANGDVPLSPLSTPAYMFAVASGNAPIHGGALPAGLLGTESSGSRATSFAFSTLPGDEFTFYFNYITSDGAGYADYGWAALYDVGATTWTTLFTARTVVSGTIVPGLGMPAPVVSLTPGSVPVVAGTDWAPLTIYSGQCYAAGCGHSGWVQASYTFGSAGTYQLAFGATNWNDGGYYSGIAVDGVMVNGVPIGTETPEPQSWMLAGFAGVGGWMLRRWHMLGANHESTCVSAECGRCCRASGGLGTSRG